MYIQRQKLRQLSTLEKRCFICGKFLFKRNLGENERYHKIGYRRFICHECFVKLERKRIEYEQSQKDNTIGNMEQPKQTT